MKVKLLVAALAFAAAGQASAAIDNGGTGNGELFLSVWDATAQTSYVRDLGIDMNTFITNGSTAGYSLSFTGDSLLAAAMAAGNPLVWNVAAMDITGGTTAGGQRYLSTTNMALGSISVSNSKITNGFYLAKNYVNAINGSDANFAANNSSAWASGTLAYFDSGFKKNWLGNANFDSTAAIGSSLNFFMLTPSSSSGLAKSSVTQFGSAQGNATWLLDANGTLTYSVPAPAAVPVPAAAWLLGSGLIGLVGVARRKAA